MLKVLKKGCEPTRGTKYSACVDLYASEDLVIGAGETKVVGLGVAIDFEKLNEIIISRELLNLVGAENIGHPSVEEDAFKESWLSSHYLDLSNRSSMSAKHGLIISNGSGKIDLDYPREIKIILHNPLSADFVEVTSKSIGLAHQLKTERYSDKEIIDSQIALCKKMGYSSESYKIKKGDKIAQITILEHKSYLFGIESEDERTDGLGSTDG